MSNDRKQLKVVSFGLGPIGLEILKQCHHSKHVCVVGAVDISPELVGQDIGELIGEEASGLAVATSIEELELPPGTIALHATGSKLDSVWPQIRQLLNYGLSVVSTCEELSYPWARYPELAAEMDQYAKQRELTILGTGINPGFIMDTLALCLSAVTNRISSIRIFRNVDVSKRRLPLQKKVGVGMAKQTFIELAAKSKIGHVGLEESVRLVAHGLNLQLTNVRNSIEPKLSPAGDEGVCGLHQTAVGQTKEGIELYLDLTMAVGVEQSDQIEILGAETRKLVIPGGIFGDTATASIAINSSKLIHATKPIGLNTMVDLSLPRNVSLV